MCCTHYCLSFSARSQACVLERVEVWLEVSPGEKRIHARVIVMGQPKFLGHALPNYRVAYQGAIACAEKAHQCMPILYTPCFWYQLQLAVMQRSWWRGVPVGSGEECQLNSWCKHVQQCPAVPRATVRCRQYILARHVVNNLYVASWHMSAGTCTRRLCAGVALIARWLVIQS